MEGARTGTPVGKRKTPGNTRRSPIPTSTPKPRACAPHCGVRPVDVPSKSPFLQVCVLVSSQVLELPWSAVSILTGTWVVQSGPLHYGTSRCSRWADLPSVSSSSPDGRASLVSCRNWRVAFGCFLEIPDNQTRADRLISCSCQLDIPLVPSSVSRWVVNHLRCSSFVDGCRMLGR